jgi:hypothetical protein
MNDLDLSAASTINHSSTSTDPQSIDLENDLHLSVPEMNRNSTATISFPTAAAAEADMKPSDR